MKIEKVENLVTSTSRVSTVPYLLVKKIFVTPDRFKIFRWLVASVQGIYWYTFEKNCYYTMTSLLKPALSPDYGQPDNIQFLQYSIYKISAISHMELKFSPEFHLDRRWSCIISSWPLGWSVLYTFKKFLLSRFCTWIYYGPEYK